MLFWTKGFAKIDGPLTFLVYDLQCYFLVSEKGKRITKVVVKSHAFLLDH